MKTHKYLPLLCAVAALVTSCRTPREVKNAIGDLSGARQHVQDYAVAAKRDLKSPQREEAMRLYSLTASTNAAFVAILENGLRFQDIDKPLLKERSGALTSASEAFVAYCSTNLPKSSVSTKDGGILIAAILTRAVLDIYDYFYKQNREKRLEQANWVKTNFAWTAWADLK